MSVDFTPGDAVIYTYATTRGTVYRVSGTVLAVTSKRVQVRFARGTRWINIVRLTRTKGKGR